MTSENIHMYANWFSVQHILYITLCALSNIWNTPGCGITRCPTVATVLPPTHGKVCSARFNVQSGVSPDCTLNRAIWLAGGHVVSSKHSYWTLLQSSPCIMYACSVAVNANLQWTDWCASTFWIIHDVAQSWFAPTRLLILPGGCQNPIAILQLTRPLPYIYVYIIIYI